MISVVIPLYNKEHYVKATIESVLSQTYPNWELIIVNDGSTDHSESIVLQFQDKRIKYVKQLNQGVSAARNKGLSLAEGAFIAFLDADDIWEKDYLEKMLNLSAAFPSYSVFCSAQANRKIKTLPDGVSIIKDHCQYNYIYFTGCMFIRKNIFEQTGGFRTGIQLGEDRDMWLRIACYHPTVYLNEETISHPYHTQNNLSQTVDKRKSFPYWEWYSYPYQPKDSLYRYATNQILEIVIYLVSHHYYSDALMILKRCQGYHALRLRLSLFLKIVWNHYLLNS